MTRSRTLSALALVGLAAWLAAAQQPPKTEPAKPADPVAEAVRTHPDVRVAEAKLRVAEAELAQAKLLVAQRLTTAQAKVEEAKFRVKAATSQFQLLQQRFQAGAAGASAFELLGTERELATAKLALSAAEAELKAATGAETVVAASGDPAISRGLRFLQAYGQLTPTSDYLSAMALLAAGANAPAAPAPLRELLDKRVRLAVAAGPFDEVMAALVKATGLSGVAFRYPAWASAKELKNPPRVGPLDGEQTVAGWLQLVLDDFNPALPDKAPPQYLGKYDIYVREYGLLMTKADLAPPGATTLGDYVRQVRAEKAAKDEKK